MYRVLNIVKNNKLHCSSINYKINLLSLVYDCTIIIKYKRKYYHCQN